jgi:transmembrane sensor
MEHTEHNSTTPAIDILIARYLGGTATSDEINQLESWVKTADQNRQYFDQMRNIWDTASLTPVATDKAFGALSAKIDKPARSRLFYSIWQKIAAILVIPLLIGTIWLISDKSQKPAQAITAYQTVSAVFGTITSVDLPDGSKAWLNAGSTLRYPLQFSEGKRTVELTGEAFFKVHADESSPFIVTTPFFNVKATGTQFNVLAYPTAGKPSVTLCEGKVNVNIMDGIRHKGENIHLSPNQHLRIDSEKDELSVTSEDIYKYYAWKDGKMVFRNDALGDVAYRIGLQYNVDMELTGTEIRKFRYRATFENESLTQVLDLLKLSSPIGYREIGQKIQQDGTYTRKKIILFELPK